MRQTKDAVALSEPERAQLRMLVGSGVASARRLTHARLLLKADGRTVSRTWSRPSILTRNGSSWSWTNSTPTSRPLAPRVFAPAETKRLADKLEIHYTPTHGSWLTMAQLELSVLQRQCLDRRLGDRATMATQVAAWVAARNAAAASVDWRFTTADARIKLRPRPPVFQK